jgi:multidrug efflux system outer membrane protein
MKHPIYLLFALALALFSCASPKTYQRPDSVYDGLRYRLDAMPQDSQSVATYDWDKVFSDNYLQQYIQAALDSNLDARIAIKNIEIASNYLYQAKAINQPTLSAGPSITYQTNSLNTQIGKILGERQHLVQFNLDVRASWELDAWGKLKSQQKAVAAEYMQSVAAHQALQSQLVAEVATAYYQLLALDAQRAVLDSFAGYRQKFIETSRALKDAGLVTEVAVKQAEAQLLNVQGQIVAIGYQTSVRENYLNMLMGASPGAVERSKLADIPPGFETAVGYPVQLLSTRPDVRAAEFNLVRTFELTNAARAAFYPTISLGANTGLQSVDLDKLFSLNSIFASVVGSLAQPLLDKRNIKTQHLVRENQQQIAYLGFRDVLLGATHEVSNALAALDAQTKIVALKQAEKKTYALATQYSEDLVANGLGNYLEIILANERTLSAELDYIQATLGQLQAQVQLYRALGGGWQ